FVTHPIPKGVLGRHVDVPQRADDAALHLHAAGWTFKYAAGRVGDVAALANGRMQTELELLGHGDLYLRVFAGWPEHADAFDASFGADDGELLFAGVLAGLREVGVLGELVAFAEQGFDVFLCEVDMMRGNLDGERLLLLRFQHTCNVRAA